MSTYVLIHGACHDGSAWDRVIERLNKFGHKAFAPTVAGHGRGVGKAVTHAESTQSIVNFVVQNGLTDIVLAGHSYGGTIICKVAEAIPERIRRLVFYSAFVLGVGESMYAAFAPADRKVLSQLAAESTDNTVMLPFNFWRERFINDASLETARWAYDQLSPEPFQQVVEPLDLRKFYTLDTPRSCLVCNEDTVMPPGPWAWHPRMSERLGVYRLIRMPGSHEVLFTNPNGLAEKLIEAGRD